MALPLHLSLHNIWEVWVMKTIMNLTCHVWWQEWSHALTLSQYPNTHLKLRLVLINIWGKALQMHNRQGNQIVIHKAHLVPKTPVTAKPPQVNKFIKDIYPHAYQLERTGNYRKFYQHCLQCVDQLLVSESMKALLTLQSTSMTCWT